MAAGRRGGEKRARVAAQDPGGPGGWRQSRLLHERQLCLAKRLQLPQAEAEVVAIELSHQLIGGVVWDGPEACHHAPRASHLKGSLQAEHALAADHLAQPSLAGRKDDQIDMSEVEIGHFHGRQTPVVAEDRVGIRRPIGAGPSARPLNNSGCHPATSSE